MLTYYFVDEKIPEFEFLEQISTCYLEQSEQLLLEGLLARTPSIELAEWLCQSQGHRISIRDRLSCSMALIYLIRPMEFAAQDVRTLFCCALQ